MRIINVYYRVVRVGGQTGVGWRAGVSRFFFFFFSSSFLCTNAFRTLRRVVEVGVRRRRSPAHDRDVGGGGPRVGVGPAFRPAKRRAGSSTTARPAAAAAAAADALGKVTLAAPPPPRTLLLLTHLLLLLHRVLRACTARARSRAPGVRVM